MRPECRGGRGDKGLSVGEGGGRKEVYKMGVDGEIGDGKGVDLGDVVCGGGPERQVLGYESIC